MTFKSSEGQKDFGIDRGVEGEGVGTGRKGDSLVRRVLCLDHLSTCLLYPVSPKTLRNSFISFSLWIRTGLISHPQSFVIPLQLQPIALLFLSSNFESYYQLAQKSLWPHLLLMGNGMKLSEQQTFILPSVSQYKKRKATNSFPEP